MGAEMMIKLFVFAAAAIMPGFLLGRSSQRHTYGGKLIFEKQPDGTELCIFKLKEDETRLERQESVVFSIDHTNLDSYICDEAQA